jgi:hypothetical protein
MLSFVGLRWMSRAAGRGKSPWRRSSSALKRTMRLVKSRSARSTSGHPAHITVECECGGKVTLSVTSTITTCSQCGTDLGGSIHDIKGREGHLPDNLTHPWFYDAQVRADQRLRDEANYPEGSPWRYNDIAEGP